MEQDTLSNPNISVTRCGNFITTVVIFRHFYDTCGNLKFVVITKQTPYQHKMCSEQI